MSPFVEPGRGFMGCSNPDRDAVDRRLAAPLTAERQAQLAAASPGTIFFPDVSNYQGGLAIAAGTAAVLAKATEADSYTDGWYANFKAQAAQRGAVFGAYHFQWSASSSEVHHVYNVVGRTPLMMDVENTSRALRLADVVNFVNGYRALGGIVHLAYIPQWYWSGTMGSPSLVPLQQLGVHVVSSNYTTYSDSGPGWNGYGGVRPVQWQYTDALRYGGMSVDFNAFKGTPGDYRTLLTGAAPAPTPTPTPQIAKELDMVIVQVDRNTVPHGTPWPGWFLLTGNGELIHIPPAQAKTNGDTSKTDNLDGLRQAGINEAGFITFEFYQELTNR
jgi:hypothetical protein